MYIIEDKTPLPQIAFSSNSAALFLSEFHYFFFFVSITIVFIVSVIVYNFKNFFPKIRGVDTNNLYFSFAQCLKWLLTLIFVPINALSFCIFCTELSYKQSFQNDSKQNSPLELCLHD